MPQRRETVWPQKNPDLPLGSLNRLTLALVHSRHAVHVRHNVRAQSQSSVEDAGSGYLFSRVSCVPLGPSTSALRPAVDNGKLFAPARSKLTLGRASPPGMTLAHFIHPHVGDDSEMGSAPSPSQPPAHTTHCPSSRPCITRVCRASPSRPALHKDSAQRSRQAPRTRCTSADIWPPGASFQVAGPPCARIDEL